MATFQLLALVSLVGGASVSGAPPASNTVMSPKELRATVLASTAQLQKTHRPGNDTKTPKEPKAPKHTESIFQRFANYLSSFLWGDRIKKVIHPPSWLISTAKPMFSNRTSATSTELKKVTSWYCSSTGVHSLLCDRIGDGTSRKIPHQLSSNASRQEMLSEVEKMISAFCSKAERADKVHVCTRKASLSWIL